MAITYNTFIITADHKEYGVYKLILNRNVSKIILYIANIFTQYFTIYFLLFFLSLYEKIALETLREIPTKGLAL